MTKKLVGKIAAAVMAGLIAITSCGFTQIASAATGDEPEKYTISLEQSEGGSLKFRDSEEAELTVAAGEEITILAVPDEDFETESVKAADEDGRELILTANENGYHLIMPESNVKVSAGFHPVVTLLTAETSELSEEQMVPENSTTEEPSSLEPETEEDEQTDAAEKEHITVPEEGTASEGSSEGVAEDIVPESDAQESTVEETETDAQDNESESAKAEVEKAEQTDAVEEEAITAPEEPQVEEKAELQWSQLSSEEVDAMVGMASVKRRMLLRASSATTIYEGSMNRFYGAATPHLYDSNGNLVYCILPWSASPHGVNVSFNDYGITSASDGNLQLMAKLMYYGYGGGGNILGGYSAADQEAITHFALSYVWMIYMGNTHGYGDWTSSGGSNLDGTGQSIVLNFLSQVQGLPAVTGTLHVAGLYEASGEVYQDLAYGNFTPEVREGDLELSKTSAYPEITNDNDCYSLEGAVYGVYTDSGCTNKAGQFTTDKNGKSTSRLTLEAGTYYVKEISPSPGYYLDTTVYTATVSSDTTSTVNVKEIPGNDPADLLLLKQDSETGKPQKGLSLAGAEYTVKYYDVSSDTDPAKTGREPDKTWVFKTDAKGWILMDQEHLVRGDSFYKVNGTTVFPLGTITLQETKEPDGYVIDSTVYVANTYMKSNTSVVTSNLPNEETRCSEEDIIRGDLKFYKLDAGTRKAMAGIPFSITSVETGESHVIISDAEGLVSTASEDRKHTANTNRGETAQDGIWFGDSKPDNAKGALIYGKYVVKELPCKANYGKDLIEFEVSIQKNSQVKKVPDTYNYDILLSTTAMDSATDTKTVPAAPGAKIVDKVAYENLTVGRTYTLKGTLMDQETGKALKVGGKSVTAEKSFTPKAAKGTISMTFELDASGLEGKTLVVFEDLYWGEDKIADHSDLKDEAQAVFVPDVHTTATDSQTKDHVGTVSEKAVVRDVVEYTGLTPGKTYHLKGVLMDKETGEPVKINGQEIAAEKDFVPETSNGSVELSVTVDSTVLSGKTTVMFETVTYKDRQVAIHADIKDEDQTVYYPEIHTSAADKETKDSVGTISKTAEIIDTVTYANLVPGKEYTVKGVLMDQSTGNEVLVNKKSVTAETSFKPASASGTVKLTFKLDSSSLQGKSVVVFEDLYHNSVKVAAHADITDKGQTINYPKIATSAADAQTKDSQGVADNKVAVKDTVTYTNLVPGKTYTIKGTLMNQQTGKEVLVNRKSVTAEKTFTPEKKDGSIELEFVLNSLLVKGQTTVVFEELYHNSIKVTAHADINDEGQSIHVPEVHTNAVDGETKNHVGTVAKKATVVDAVSFSNLIPGKEYTVKGTLMDKATGKEILVNGKPVTAEKAFTPEEPDGEVELAYELDSSALAGKTVVVFEDLLYKGVKIYAHADISDEKQSVHYPEIHTSAKDAVTGDAQAQVSGSTTITDTVTYRNLVPGETYTLMGTLMDKGTKEPLSVDGTVVTAQKTFMAEAADGETTLSFTFPAEELQGATTVVFEKLYIGEVNVTSHADLEDEGQTIYIPKVRTTAVDKDTKSHTGMVKQKAVIEDIVNYSNLITGCEYTVKGTLMNKETGEALMQNGKEIAAEKTFTAETTDGSVVLTFEFDSSLLEGKTVVAFEDLYHDDILLVSHANIEDEEQSVHYPKIGTNASVGGSKTVVADTFVTLTDVVSYENLIPGEKYSVQGILMNKASGKELVVNGNTVKTSADFTAEKASGQVEVTFSFDAEGLGGHSTVVFEKLFHNGKEITRHEDLSDEGQTVTFTAPPVPPVNPPKTGDANTTLPFVAALIAAGAGLAVLIYRKKRLNR